jgi:hypothetical protein
MALEFTREEPVVRTWNADDGAGKAYEVTLTKNTSPDRYTLEVKVNSNSVGTVLLDTAEEFADLLAQVGADLDAELGV